MANHIGAAVVLRLRPKPKYLHETRPILDALKKFGEVNTFKNLKFDFNRAKPNPYNRTIHVIFDDKEAAQRAIAASPLTIPITQPPSHAANTPASSEFSEFAESSPPLKSNAVIKRRRNHRIPPTEEIKCTIELDDNHIETMTNPRTKFNVYNTRKSDNPILRDLQGPETRIPLPQLADTIEREGVTLFDKRKRPDPDAPTLMEIYRQGLRDATNARNQRTTVVTSERTEANARESRLGKLAKAKTSSSQANVED
ncbi:uncharacterized protein N7469_007829 [Penicillium citrinum]|uniref:Uncharacterized protein n=1 Tax=Penicillium citrinum TaxID=5077 RepID=A0A9W9NQH7_PENCI|nr:uncharacterized protein N7469_007829 [Penicillium citrinum]KAJ5224326.1 hypothetical protein N7469_007829 [Penicillium citrinum]